MLFSSTMITVLTVTVVTIETYVYLANFRQRKPSNIFSKKIEFKYMLIRNKLIYVNKKSIIEGLTEKQNNLELKTNLVLTELIFTFILNLKQIFITPFLLQKQFAYRTGKMVEL